MTLSAHTRKQASTPDGTPAKPSKPYPDFPLFPHASGQWAKKILGRMVYFGPWDDPHGALARYTKDRDHLHAGMPVPDVRPTLHKVVNLFLADKASVVAAGEMSARQLAEYTREAAMLLTVLGETRDASLLRPADFAKVKGHILQTCGPTTAANRIIRIRSIFRWAHDTRLIDQPANYGHAFAIPPARVIRAARRQTGPLLFEAHEILTLLDALGKHPKMKAMVLLAINCGFGAADCSSLEVGDIDGEWIDHARRKTEVERRCWLWPETRDALAAVLEARRDMDRVPATLKDRVFITSHREAYVRFSPAKGQQDSIGAQFSKQLRTLGLHRKQHGFYSLRRTFATVADETRDWPAIDRIMGHTPSDSASAGFNVGMRDRYRQAIGDDRLIAVCRHVRTWLFGEGQEA